MSVYDCDDLSIFESCYNSMDIAVDEISALFSNSSILFEDSQLSSMLNSIDNLFNANFISVNEAEEKTFNVFQKAFDGIVTAIHFLVDKIRKLFDNIVGLFKRLFNMTGEYCKKIKENVSALKNKNLDKDHSKSVFADAADSAWNEFLSITPSSSTNESAALLEKRCLSDNTGSHQSFKHAMFGRLKDLTISDSKSISGEGYYIKYSVELGSEPDNEDNTYYAGTVSFNDRELINILTDVEYAANMIDKARLEYDHSSIENFMVDMKHLFQSKFNIDIEDNTSRKYADILGSFDIKLNYNEFVVYTPEKAEQAATSITKTIYDNNKLLNIGDVKTKAESIERALTKVIKKAKLAAKNAKADAKDVKKNSKYRNSLNPFTRHKHSKEIYFANVAINGYNDIENLNRFIVKISKVLLDILKDIYMATTIAYKVICRQNDLNRISLKMLNKATSELRKEHESEEEG